MGLIKLLRLFFKDKKEVEIPIVANHIVTFSGLFSYDKKGKSLIQRRNAYNVIQPNEKILDIIQNQYYKVFRKFILNDCHKDYMEVGSSNSYNIKINVRDNEWEKVKVENIVLSFFDDNIRLGIYSFDVKLDNGIAFDSFIYILSRLRHFSTNVKMGEDSQSLLKFIELNILRCEDNPKTNYKFKIDKTSSVYDYSGGKLKSFIAVEINELTNDYVLDEALFELGTFSEFGSSKKHTSAGSPSLEYFNAILSKKISIFRNWSALALFDSFVMIGGKGYFDQKDTISTIRGSYFKIFLFNLYSKFYLFKTNTDLESSKDMSYIKILYSFLRKYDLSHISYNFLPNILHSEIREALQIDEELRSIKSKMNLIESQEKENETNLVNAFLFFIAILSIISVLSDFPDVIDNIFNECNKSVPTYIGFGVIAFAFAILYIRHKWRKNKNI